MSHRRLPSQVGPDLETLASRHVLFQMLKTSHLKWMDQMDDPDLMDTHRSLAALFESAVQQYEVLVEILQRQHGF